MTEEFIMANTNQIKRGLGSFIGTEIMPNIPGGTFKKVAVGTVLDLFLDNIENALADKDSMLMSLLGVRDAGGGIDVHKIAERIKSNMPDEGLKIDVKVWGFRLGEMTLHKSDIDTLVQHITSA
jgi:hypothetical protein